MVAIVGSLVAHVPPLVPSDKVMPEPMHTCESPVMEEGVGNIVTTVVAIHEPTLYVMAALPAESPVTVPALASIVPTAGVPLLHEPPEVVSLKVVLAPTQAVNVPDIVPAVLTTTERVVVQP